jgi:hypothetical protein
VSDTLPHLTASSCAKRFTEAPIFHLFAVPFCCSYLRITNNSTTPKHPTKHSIPHRIESRVLPLGRLKEDSIGIEVCSLKDLSFTQNIRQGSRNCETSFKPGASKSLVILQHAQASSITPSYVHNPSLSTFGAILFSQSRIELNQLLLLLKLDITVR